MPTEMAVTRARLLHQELARFIEIVTQQMQPECTILFGSLANALHPGGRRPPDRCTSSSGGPSSLSD